jgi:hypothetical protein
MIRTECLEGLQISCDGMYPRAERRSFAVSGSAADTRIPHNGQRSACRLWRSTTGVIGGSSTLLCSAAKSAGSAAQQPVQVSGR